MHRALMIVGPAAQASPVTERPASRALEAHCAAVRPLHLKQLFADDPGRGERFTAEASGLCLDDAKNRATEETMRLLARWGDQRPHTGSTEAG